MSLSGKLIAQPIRIPIPIPKLPAKSPLLRAVDPGRIPLQYQIKIKDTKSSEQIVVPWLPEKIKLSSGGTSFSSYSLLDFGKIVRPKGVGLRKVSWEGTFPGRGRKGTPYPKNAGWKKPDTYQNQLEKWKKKKTILKLVIAETPINMTCYLEDYKLTYSGGFGDVRYSVKFVEYKQINIKVQKKVSTKRPEKTSKTYTVKPKDCLYNIAAKKLGKGSRWKEIYKINKAIIEKAAKAKGKKSSNNGNLIYAGTVLKLPKK